MASLRSNPHPADLRPRLTASERASNCMAAVDRLWERCEKGVNFVYPPADTRITPDQQRDAARLMIRLMQAADRLTRTAENNDRTAVDRWERKREAYYLRRGWSWPMSSEEREEARGTAMHLRQMAFDGAPVTADGR